MSLMQNAIAAIRPLGASVVEPYVLGAANFALLPAVNPKRYNVTYDKIDGTQYIRLEARQGDSNNEPLVDRVGLDGFNTVLDAENYFEFLLIPGLNCESLSASDWWSFFEIHAKKDPAHPTEYEGSGPVSFNNEWSGGFAAGRFRIHLKVLNTDPPVSAGSITLTTLYDAPQLVRGNRYKFRVGFLRHATAGYLRVWMTTNGGAEVQVVNYTGQTGYGPARALYPQFRIYRNNRPLRQIAYFKPLVATTAPAPGDGNQLTYLGDPLTYLGQPLTYGS